MPLKFRPSSGEITTHAEFAAPAFDLFREPAVLYREFFTELSRYGLAAKNVRLDTGAGSLGDAVVTFQLPDMFLIVRLRVESIELYCYDLLKTNYEGLNDVALGVARAIGAINPRITYKTYGLNLSAHGALGGASASTYISRFVKSSPERLGPVLGNTLIFYYGAHEQQLSAAVTLEPSARVRDELWARIQATWDASKISVQELGTLAGRYLEDVFSVFDLEWVRG